MTEPVDFRALAEASPNPYMTLDPALRYVWCNAAYEAVVGRTLDEIRGRHLFDAFPSEGEPRRQLEESLLDVFRHGRPTTIALIPYAIADESGRLEERWWTATHTPLFAPDGAVALVLQHTSDVTELQRLRQAAYDATREAEAALAERDIFLRAQTVQSQNRSLVAATERFRGLFMQAPGFIAVLRGPDHVFEFANNAYLELVGRSDVVGRPVVDALPEVRDQGFSDLLDGVLRSGRAYVGRDIPIRLHRSPDGEPEARFLDFIYQPIVEADGSVSGVFVEGYDVTEARQARERQRLLLDELNHRVKNTLATVQAIAAQTLSSSASPAAFRDSFESRLMALSQTHNLLTAQHWRGAALDDILDQELHPFAAGRVERSGPPVQLPARAALAVAMCLHELATNAAKYGALSTPAGRLTVAWSLATRNGGESLRITWIESGGPPVQKPSRRGFGSRLLQRSIGGELGGEALLEFNPDGLQARLQLPLEHDEEAAWTRTPPSEA